MKLAARVELRRGVVFGLVYLAAYFVASWMDLATTSLGLTQPGVSEKNVLAVTGEGYSAVNAWWLTVGGAFVLAGCVAESFRNRRRVDERWLEHPVRSFGILYVNPWSAEALRFSPVHFLSLALAFPLLRVLAALNNLMAYGWGFGPMGRLMEWVALKTSPLAGFALIGCSIFLAATLAVSPWAARILRSWRTRPA